MRHDVLSELQPAVAAAIITFKKEFVTPKTVKFSGQCVKGGVLHLDEVFKFVIVGYKVGLGRQVGSCGHDNGPWGIQGIVLFCKEILARVITFGQQVEKVFDRFCAKLMVPVDILAMNASCVILVLA